MFIEINELYQQAIDKFGPDNQLAKCSEELEELAVELRKKSLDRHAILSETADVFNTLKQLMIILNISDEMLYDVRTQKMKKCLDHTYTQRVVPECNTTITFYPYSVDNFVAEVSKQPTEEVNNVHTNNR